MRKLFVSLILFAIGLGTMACGENGSTNNASTNVALVNDPPQPKPPKPESNSNAGANTNVEPTAKTITPQLRKLIDVEWEAVGSTKGSVYNATYTTSNNGEVAAELTVMTMEAEIFAIEIRLTPLGKMYRLVNVQNELGYDSGPKFVMSQHSSVKQCFSAVKRVVGIYESKLRVEESVLENLLYIDCTDLPRSWLIPNNEEQFDLEKYKANQPQTESAAFLLLL